ncbi:MAG: ABC transporter substrate-binding protein [Ilumatobacteraceae bacterium]
MTQVAIDGLVSFSLIAAACGSDDDGDAEPASTEAPSGTEAGEPEPEPEPDGEPEAEPEPATTELVEGEIDTEDVVTEEEEPTGPVAGGTIRYGLEAEVDGINPTTSALSSPGLMMGNAVFDNLVAFDTDGNAVPYLAESVEPVDGDISTWQVKLREGITFHDGTPLNAEAVQVNFEAQRGDLLVGLAVRPYFPEEGATEIIDDLTIQFNLLDENALFPGTIAGQLGMVASPTWLAAALENPELNQEPVGTGPFVFDSRSQDSVTRFVRNDAWWNGDVFLDALEFVPVTDPDTRADLLRSGDLQALQTDDPANAGDLIDDDAIQNVIDETGEEEFAMINSAAPPFDDIRAREAITRATPLENYRQLIGLGIARAADQRFIPESQYYNPDVVQLGDDPDGALELVAAYCADFPENCSDGKINVELQFSGPSVVQTRIAEILTEGWSEGGFNVTLDELPQDEHIQQTAFGEYQINTWRQFGAVDPAPDNVWLECRSIGGISLNWPKFCDPERDTLLLDAQKTLDPATRIPLYQEVSQKVNEDYLYIFFTHSIWDNAFAENVRGVCDRTSPEGAPLRCSTNGRTWHSSVWLAE